MAALGATVLGLDLAAPMLEAARQRSEASGVADLVVGHGTWNLARSAAEFRRAVAEAARMVRPEISCRAYRPRKPRGSPLFQLVERRLEELLGLITREPEKAPPPLPHPVARYGGRGALGQLG